MASNQFYFSVNDTLDPITVTCYDTDPASGALRIADLTTATGALLYAGRSPNLTSLFNGKAMTFLSPRSNGQVSYTPVAGDIAVAGTYDCCVVVTWNTGAQSTFPNDGAFNGWPQILVSRLP